MASDDERADQLLCDDTGDGAQWGDKTESNDDNLLKLDQCASSLQGNQNPLPKYSFSQLQSFWGVDQGQDAVNAVVVASPATSHQ